jgi:hypothetical protein
LHDIFLPKLILLQLTALTLCSILHNSLHFFVIPNLSSTISQNTLYLNRLEKILTMVYAVQNYKAYFGLYPSSGIYKTKKPQHFGDWICLRPQLDPVSETLWFFVLYILDNG